MIRFGMLRCSDSPTQIVDPIGDENTEDGLPAEVRQHKWETPGPARQRCRRPARERHENPRGGTVSRTLVAQRLMGRACWTKVQHECPMETDTKICVQSFGLHYRACRQQDTDATMIGDETQLLILFGNGQAPQ
jgi:hypothetical protein